jgi:hypothetical protein
MLEGAAGKGVGYHQGGIRRVDEAVEQDYREPGYQCRHENLAQEL